MVFEETGPYFYSLMLQRSMVMRYLSVDRQQRRTVRAEAEDMHLRTFEDSLFKDMHLRTFKSLNKRLNLYTIMYQRQLLLKC